MCCKVMKTTGVSEGNGRGTNKGDMFTVIYAATQNYVVLQYNSYEGEEILELCKQGTSGNNFQVSKENFNNTPSKFKPLEPEKPCMADEVSLSSVTFDELENFEANSESLDVECIDSLTELFSNCDEMLCFCDELLNSIEKSELNCLSELGNFMEDTEYFQVLVEEPINMEPLFGRSNHRFFSSTPREDASPMFYRSENNSTVKLKQAEHFFVLNNIFVNSLNFQTAEMFQMEDPNTCITLFTLTPVCLHVNQLSFHTFQTKLCRVIECSFLPLCENVNVDTNRLRIYLTRTKPKVKKRAHRTVKIAQSGFVFVELLEDTCVLTKMRPLQLKNSVTNASCLNNYNEKCILLQVNEHPKILKKFPSGELDFKNYQSLNQIVEKMGDNEIQGCGVSQGKTKRIGRIVKSKLRTAAIEKKEQGSTSASVRVPTRPSNVLQGGDNPTEKLEDQSNSTKTQEESQNVQKTTTFTFGHTKCLNKVSEKRAETYIYNEQQVEARLELKRKDLPSYQLERTNYQQSFYKKTKRTHHMVKNTVTKNDDIMQAEEQLHVIEKDSLKSKDASLKHLKVTFDVLHQSLRSDSPTTLMLASTLSLSDTADILSVLGRIKRNEQVNSCRYTSAEKLERLFHSQFELLSPYLYENLYKSLV